MGKIEELKVYLDKISGSEKNASGQKKEFWKREIKRTKAKIEELSK